ncbi:unnamed protein product [Arabidopsis thaliana]|uniref:(thale cress) hypothetical protein n=1 Tax=Arabidopsis thaliana TaxID=3702 RepID=A0A7G2FGW7_ARATH|nr:unnamed protein product [Arabidopsis thaliana]
MLLLGHLHGFSSCIEKERKALLELKKFVMSRCEECEYDSVLPTWTNDTKSDCCQWENIKCNRTSRRLTGLSIYTSYYLEISLLNLSLLHPFEEVRSLDLSNSRLNGLVDDVEGYKSLRRLRNLQILNFSSNEFNNSIFPFLNAATSLTTLSLRRNNMYGPIPLKELKNLTNLELLDLSGNRIDGSMPVREFPYLKKLKALDLRLKNLTNLEVLSLGYNYFDGPIPIEVFCEMKNLQELDLRGINFVVASSPSNIYHCQIIALKAFSRSIHLPTSQSSSLEKIPNFLMYQKNLHVVDLSGNRISGIIPTWLLENNPELEVLQLKNNSFTIFQMPTSVHNLQVLDFSENNIGGLFPDNFGRVLPNLLSHNKFSGHFLPRQTNFTSLIVLRINNNLFTGKIGVGLLTLVDLCILDMSNNFLEGPIPDTFLGSIQILDLRNNKLSGNIPQFVDTQDISFLLLRGNSLTGYIPSTLCEFSKMRLLDLSDNKLNGFIPSCFNNLSFGLARKEEITNYYVAVALESFYLGFYKSTFVVENFRLDYSNYFEIDVKFATKQRYDSYIGAFQFSEGTLNSMYGLDLSSNELSGVIPAELGDLFKLRALNLSHNFLSSHIPDSFSKLQDIESLDLSYNMLQGSIPHQLTNLTSLAVFNVSYNNLSGIIPQGKQFNTFDENSYLGNPLLCGPPTDTSCETKKNSEENANGGEEDDKEVAIDMLVFYWSTAATYVTALIGILVLMCVDCSWRRAWLRLVDAFIASAKSKLA